MRPAGDRWLFTGHGSYKIESHQYKRLGRISNGAIFLLCAHYFFVFIFKFPVSYILAKYSDFCQNDFIKNFSDLVYNKVKEKKWNLIKEH